MDIVLINTVMSPRALKSSTTTLFVTSIFYFSKIIYLLLFLHNFAYNVNSTLPLIYPHSLGQRDAKYKK